MSIFSQDGVPTNAADVKTAGLELATVIPNARERESIVGKLEHRREFAGRYGSNAQAVAALQHDHFTKGFLLP